MDPHKDPIERAFELARTGRYNTVSEIVGRLKTEGLSVRTIIGVALNRQLRDLIRKAQRDEDGNGDGE